MNECVLHLVACLIQSINYFSLCSPENTGDLKDHEKILFLDSIIIYYHMLIEQTVEELYVHTKEYRLTVAYVEKIRKGVVHGSSYSILKSITSNP
jgi:hypothetical protein